jgi:hypothetical protein
MPPIPKISSGFLTKAALLLKKIEEYAPISREELGAIVEQDEIIIRNSKDQILNLIEESEWINSDENGIISVAGGLGLDDSSPLNEIQMELLWKYMIKWDPHWSKTVSRGIRSTRSRLSPSDVRQIFNELGLLGSIEDMGEYAKNWWFRVKSHNFEMRNKKKEETGLEGEKLSMSYEVNRTRSAPIHSSIESDSLGYDIESVLSEDEAEPIYIEVKASRATKSQAKMHLTRNEYNASRKKSDSYFFHLWLLNSDAPALAIVPGQEVAKHCPKDNEEGIWSVVEIPFSVFDEWEEWKV